MLISLISRLLLKFNYVGYITLKLGSYKSNDLSTDVLRAINMADCLYIPVSHFDEDGLNLKAT